MITSKTFMKDRLIRDKSGVPIGRCVLVDDSAYEEGTPLFVVIVSIPVSYYGAHSHVYIDGTPYLIPKKVPPVRRSSNGLNVVLNNVTLIPDV